MEKNKDMGCEKYIPLDFVKYQSYSEVQKNSKVVNVYTLYRNNFLGSECIFRLEGPTFSKRDSNADIFPVKFAK